MFPEVMKVAVISTAHLTRLDHDLLEAAIDVERHAGFESDWDHPFVILNDNHYGYWIYCGHEGLDGDDPYIVNEAKTAGFSDTLIKILVKGKQAGLSYIRFDCDGNIDDNFEKFEWSTIREENVIKLAKQLRAIVAEPAGSEAHQALITGLILGMIPQLDANADEVLQACGLVGMPWTYKDIPRLFVLANKSDLIKDGEFFLYDPNTKEIVSESL